MLAETAVEAARRFGPAPAFVTDEGLNGLHLHLVNDSAVAFDGEVKVELFARGQRFNLRRKRYRRRFA